MESETRRTPLHRRHRRWPGWALALLLLLAAVPAWGSDLWLPKGAAAALIASLERDCPACLERGVAPCGTADIQPGRRFAKEAFQGKPRRGYLMSFAMSHAAFRETLLDGARERVAARLDDRFRQVRLVILEDGFAAARVLPPPAAVSIVYSAAQHRCLGVERRTWSCCLGDGGSDRTCLPKADAPHATMTWHDDVAGEDIVATYTPVPGFSRLQRSGPGSASLYYCLTDEAGWLKSR